MEVQGASKTLRDAVGYRSRRFLRRQRETRQVKISQVFFWDLYDDRGDRSTVPSASNPFRSHVSSGTRTSYFGGLGTTLYSTSPYEDEGIRSAFRGNRTAYLS